MHARGWLRFVTMLFAAAQFALPAALSIGDAIAFSDAPSSRAHVEDTSRTSCTAPHADDCAVCRYLSTLAAPPHTGCFDIPRGMGGEAAEWASASAASLRQIGFLSRAPPYSFA